MSRIRIDRFMGEVPRLAARHLSTGYAQEAVDTRLVDGSLRAARERPIQHTLGADSQTFYFAQGEWIRWPGVVDVVPGPVKSNRLYVTGDGVPKVRLVGGAIRPLKIAPINTRPAVKLITNNERITIGDREIGLQNGRTAKTSTGVNVAVSTRGNTATITLSHPTGISEAAAATLIESLKYRNASTPVQPGLKVARILSIKDNGGQVYDDDRNPLGSDTRYLERVASKVFVGGTSEDIDISAPDAPDSTDTAGQNDPPTLVVTGADPTFASGDAAKALFTGATISTIEAGQLILRIVFSIDGLANAGIDRDLSQTLVYAYTHVTDLDEETAPSPLSDTILWSPGQTVRVTGFVAGDASRGTNRYRIYRSQTNSLGQTDLYFVGEVPRLTAEFLDRVGVRAANEPLSTIDFNTPLDELEGITAMPNGMMAAFVGRDLYFCEPWKPHAWPVKYTLRADSPIVGLVAVGSALAILTDGCPYLAQGTHPSTMRMDRIEVNLPCMSRRGIVDLGYAGAYASSDGLVMIDTSGARLVTKNLFTEEQWRALNPAGFIASQIDGRYVAAYTPTGGDKRMLLLDLTGEQPFVSYSSAQPAALFFQAGAGRLYFLDGPRSIRMFDDSGGARIPYRWVSSPFIGVGATNYGAIIIESDDGSGDIALTVVADGVDVATITQHNEIERLPSGFRARRWEFRAVGTRRINAISMAHTAADLAVIA